jgi:hypothetical protein
MSSSVKRGISSLSFSLNKLYRAITTVKPSSLVISVISVSIAVFLFGGGLYDLVMKPLPAVYYGGRFLILYPQLTEQFIGDSIVAMTVYALGIIGMITVYQSSRYVYKPRQAYMLLLIGFVFVFLAYMFLEQTIRIKLGR